MFFRTTKNTLSAQSVKVKSDKLAKRVMKDAKRRIRKGELLDCRSLGMHLSSIDARYDYLRAEVNNATLIADYVSSRAQKLAKTRQLIEFYNNDYRELKNLYQVVERKAKEAGRTDDLQQDDSEPLSLDKLRRQFEKLSGEHEQEEAREAIRERPAPQPIRPVAKPTTTPMTTPMIKPQMTRRMDSFTVANPSQNKGVINVTKK